MGPTRMVSIVLGVLEGFAAVGVKSADDEEGDGDAEVDEVSHGVRMLFRRHDACSTHPAELKAGLVPLKERKKRPFQHLAKGGRSSSGKVCLCTGKRLRARRRTAS